MTTLADRFVFVLVDATVKATVLLALAVIIVVFARRASASFRHLIWVLGLGCALILPLLSQTLPHWRVPLRTPVVQPRQAALSPPPALAPSPEPSGTKNESASISAASAAPSQATEVTSPVHSVPMPAAPAYPAMPAQVPWAAWTLLVWAVGVLLVLARIVRGAISLRAVAATSNRVEDGMFAAVKAAAMKAMQVNCPVVLLIGSKLSRVAVPLTWGARCPVVVLPADATTWLEDKLRASLLHEMAHVRRVDWLLQTVAHLICALYWFNPLVWLAARKMRAESETACDDLVLAAGMPAADYAQHLLDIALCARDERRSVAVAVGMAQTPKIEGRLRTVLALGLSRRPPTRRIISGVLVTGLALAIPLAALRLVVHAQGVAVPAASRLQLQGDFTLRYAVTIRNQQTTASLRHEYQQLRTSYQTELSKDPFFQPVPEEFYMPFATFQQRRNRTRHVVITVSSNDGKLLYQTVEDNDSYSQVYDGHNTQTFGNGHAGATETGRPPVMADCPMPAVGLPYLPLLQDATLVGLAAQRQTWNASIFDVGTVQGQDQPYYMNGLAHATRRDGTWKLLDTDNSSQQWQFFQHQRFQNLWLASRMRLIKYDINALPPSGQFTTLQSAMGWFRTMRYPSEVSDYRLLSASSTPFDLASLAKHVPGRQALATHSQQMDDLNLQEALHLRYHLQDWAQSSKTLLQQMAADPGDRTFAARVSQSLQTLPFPLWRGYSHPAHVWDGDPRVGHDGQKPVFTAERLSPQVFTAARDFEIARSRNAGTSHIVLWASGRITSNKSGGIEKVESQQEIVPAFFVGNMGNIAEDTPDAASEASPNASAVTQLTFSNAAATMPAPRFRRYVSKPLPNGTRYTFLYPAYLHKIDQGSLDQSNQFITVRIAADGQREVVPQTQKGILIMERGTHILKLVPHEEFCGVVVGPPDSSYVGKEPLRQERQWVGEYGSHHDLCLTDAHTRRRFLLTHEDRYLRDLFVQTDPVIMSSFRILSPGTTVR